MSIFNAANRQQNILNGLGEPTSVRQQTPEEQQKVASAMSGMGEPTSVRQQTPEEQQKVASAMSGMGEPTSVRQQTPEEQQRIAALTSGLGEPTSVRQQTPEEQQKVAAAMGGPAKPEPTYEKMDLGEPTSIKQITPEERQKAAVAMGLAEPEAQQSGTGFNAPPPPKMDEAMIAAAKPVEAQQVDYTQAAIDLFKKTHGSEYDPRSAKDKGKLQNMIKMLQQDGGIKGRSPNQIALEFYRRFPSN